MFTTLTKISYTEKYGKSIFDRYYHQWDNAKTVMDNEVSDMLQNGWVISGSVDRMNVEKGFYEYEKKLKNGTSEITFALLESYFADEF